MFQYTPIPNSVDTGQQLTNIAKNTNNDVIVALVVLALVVVALAVPIMILMNRRDKDKLSQYIQRDKIILDAFGQNSKVTEDMISVLSGLKATLEVTNSRCIECKSEQMRKFDMLIIGQGELQTKIAILTDRKESEDNG